jgi:hypothetical protein
MNEQVLELTGLDRWHKYEGEHGLSVAFEGFDTGKPSLGGMATDARKVETDKSDHGYCHAMIVHTFLPKRRIVILDKSDENMRKYSLPYMLKHKPDTAGRSESYRAKRDPVDGMTEVTKFCSIFLSSGDKADAYYNSLIDLPYNIGVGAVSLKDGKVIVENYTAKAKNVWCSGFADIKFITDSGSIYIFDGTSASAPFAETQIGKINELILSKIGTSLTMEQAKAYIKAHRVDAGTPGSDEYTGWGYVKLPKPDVAERELFQLLKIGESLYAEAQKLGRKLTTADYLSAAKDWRLPE